MTEKAQLALAVGTIIANAAVTWATVRAQVVWLRRDVDELRARVFGVRA